jgi:hypothetical protein
MKAYLITTGTIFGLIASMHLLKSINDWPTVTSDPWGYVRMSAALSGSAWWLLRGSDT